MCVCPEDSDETDSVHVCEAKYQSGFTSVLFSLYETGILTGWCVYSKGHFINFLTLETLFSR